MTSALTIIDKLNLDEVLSSNNLAYDLVAGTARRPSQEREIYVSSDVLTGIYNALKDEAGDAWRLILKNCGSIWGKRLAKSIDKELTLNGQARQTELSVRGYQKLVEGYFPMHGWGKMTIDLNYTVSHGFLEASMENSIFVHLIEDETLPVDAMIAGILAGFFSHVSGYDLDAVEVCCEALGSEKCRFLVSGAERIESLEEAVEAKTEYSKVREMLCQ